MDYKALLTFSPNPYVLMDPDLVIVWANEAYLRVTMQTESAIVGRNVFDAFPSEGESHDLLSSSFDRVLETRKADEIALIRYDIRAPDGSMSERFWSATHTPILDDDGEITHILQHTVDVTELHKLRQLREEVRVVERAGVVQARNLDLEEQTERMRRMFEQAPGFVALLDGPDHVFQLANDAYYELTGNRELIGLSVAEAMPEMVEQGFVRVLDEVWKSGTPYFGRSEEIFLDLATGRKRMYLEFIYQPISDHNGNPTGIYVQGYDVTEEVMAQRRQELLLEELNHRVKNTLAVVQGLAGQSFRTIDATGEARRIFNERLRALAAAHDLLTSQNWEASTLSDTLVSSIQAATGDDLTRFDLDGPNVLLSPKLAVALAMTVHELCTNAVKYGALSTQGGRCAITWSVEPAGDERDSLTIEWRESGGPPVVKPQRCGFGTRLIEAGFVMEHDGEAALQYEPEGLQCTIRLKIVKQGK